MYEEDKLTTVVRSMSPDCLYDGYGFVIEVGDGRVYKIPFDLVEDPSCFMVDIEVNNNHVSLYIEQISKDFVNTYYQVSLVYYIVDRYGEQRVFDVDHADIYYNTPDPWISSQQLEIMIGKLDALLNKPDFVAEPATYVRQSDVDLTHTVEAAAFLVQDTRGLEALEPPEEPEEDQEVTEIDSAWDLF